jgi:hypothetical protein
LRFFIASKERAAPGFISATYSLTTATPTVGTSTRVDPGVITVSTGSVVLRCISRLRRAVISQRLLDRCVQSALPSFSLNVSVKLALEGRNLLIAPPPLAPQNSHLRCSHFWPRRLKHLTEDQFALDTARFEVYRNLILSCRLLDWCVQRLLLRFSLNASVVPALEGRNLLVAPLPFSPQNDHLLCRHLWARRLKHLTEDQSALDTARFEVYCNLILSRPCSMSTFGNYNIHYVRHTTWPEPQLLHPSNDVVVVTCHLYRLLLL